MRYFISCVILLWGAGCFCNAQTVSSDIDSLELCHPLTQEERNRLKQYPIICDALAVVYQMPRYAQDYGPLRCRSFKDITHTLLAIGDKEAAKAALRLMHKEYVAMSHHSQSQPDLFFSSLTRSFDFNSTVWLSPDEFYTQEFLDDLIARCHNDFSERQHFRRALSSVVYGMVGNPGRMHTDDELDRLDMGFLEKVLNFITRIPHNKTCEGMRKELFLQAFRYILVERVSPLVNELTDPEIKKEFSGYLAELRENQRQISMLDTLNLGRNLNAPPSREELQRLVESTEEVFPRCTAMLTLATHDLEQEKIEQAVKQLRDMEAFFAANKEKLRMESMRGIEPFYSTLAATLIQKGKYEQGIDYLIEGAGKFADGLYCAWSTSSHRPPFMIPPLLELRTAIQNESVRANVRKKLQALLQSTKDFKTIPESQQFRAVIEMQIALGFEGDAIPALKMTKFVEKGENASREPLWDARTVTKYQLRCGLFDEAMATYSKLTFRDTDTSNGHRFPMTTDRTEFLQELVTMAIAQGEYNHAEKIIELVRQEERRLPMRIAIALAYQKSGNTEKALEIVLAVSHPDGYLGLLTDLLADQTRREQNGKLLETLCNKYCEEIKPIEESRKRYEQYFAIFKLLHWADQREAAMTILEEVDSPYHAAWILLGTATEHEQAKRVLNSQVYPDYYTKEQLVIGEYNSPNHYLNLASAIKSAEEILNQAAEKKPSLPGPPFEPDKAAMKILLDNAAGIIVKETDPLHRTNTLGAIGKMEFVYFSKEKAQKRFDEALELLKSVKIEPSSSPMASQLPLFYMEIGEKEKALESVKIAIFGNDPNEPVEIVDTNQAVMQKLQSNIPLLEVLAQNGAPELAAQFFHRIYDHFASEPSSDDYTYVMPKQLATLQIIALYHDRQNPENPMLPKAKEQYQDYFSQLIQAVGQHKKDGYYKESALQNALLGWVNSEKRIQAVQTEIENQTETSGIAEQHLLRRQLGYPNSLSEFGNPFYREPWMIM